jgi:hypothetical protein
MEKAQSTRGKHQNCPVYRGSAPHLSLGNSSRRDLDGRDKWRNQMELRDHHSLHTIAWHQFRVLSRIALLSVLPLAGMMSVSRSDSAPAVPQELQFDIVRKGAVVGHHQITFRRDGENLRVNSDLKIRIKMLFFTVFRYKQTREEVWRGGKLIGLVSLADDDGTLYDIKGAVGPKGLIITAGNLSWILPPDSVPASYWNMSMVTAKGPLVNAQSGRVTDVKPVRVGDEEVTAGGKQIVATHYRLFAKTPRDVWYDANGRWVKMTTTVRDGSLVEWVLK